MKTVFLVFSYLHREKPNMPVMLHTLLFAKEMKEKGDEVKIILEGEGVLWARDLLKEDHPLSNHVKPLLEDIVVCEACANIFKVMDDIKDRLTLENDLYGHVSLKKYLDKGYSVISL
ncbi:MAG TPA: hypothetical protein EYH15_02300 [Methanothermococcus okinawensis]|uniref:DsrE family protein n=1 Tax=Methanothermococcus okinawensis TaxID=155863 RepID=A0A833DZS1_9EURY|nr:hypothetical protein [Methanococcaceae archaeon]HIP84304.1 hypothetical protein [Methanothermococcus okinawensis]HIP91599.1 hypothetical protein [Methanothermococcus okinawensis]